MDGVACCMNCAKVIEKGRRVSSPNYICLRQDLSGTRSNIKGMLRSIIRNAHGLIGPDFFCGVLRHARLSRLESLGQKSKTAEVIRIGHPFIFESSAVLSVKVQRVEKILVDILKVASYRRKTAKLDIENTGRPGVKALDCYVIAADLYPNIESVDDWGRKLLAARYKVFPNNFYHVLDNFILQYSSASKNIPLVGLYTKCRTILF